MNKFFRIFIFSVLFLSCSSNLDFDQVNDLELKPIVVANLASFDIPPNQFVSQGIERILLTDEMNFKVFNDVDFINNLSRTDLYFEFNNTINRAFTINLYFFDANDANIYTIPLLIPAYSGTLNEVTKTEVFENVKLEILKITQKITFSIEMTPGLLLTESSQGNLKMRSSATIYFKPQ